ncbi:ABC transporter substrate-binding protein, partial [Candidatus Roizmanbacteria bacterium CG_4_9_14_0_8_um_filter_34_12]
MKKILFSIEVVVIIGLGIFTVANSTQKLKKDSKRLTVVTTLFPLYDFVKIIGQDKVEVSLLLPPGVEAHSFEPKPSDIVRINKSDLFIYTGKFMEPWAEDIIKGVTNKKVVSV